MSAVSDQSFAESLRSPVFLKLSFLSFFYYVQHIYLLSSPEYYYLLHLQLVVHNQAENMIIAL
ncbi:MAG: hypothetical protein ACK55Z_28745, partial [bacterium]